MARPDEIQGNASTFATVRYWMEEEFRYADLVYVAKGSDARRQFIELHNPPLVIVESVRYDNLPAVLPASGGAPWPYPGRPWNHRPKLEKQPAQHDAGRRQADQPDPNPNQ